MVNDFFDGSGLTQEGAKRIVALIEKRPELKNQIGKTTWVDRMHHSSKLSEIRVDDLRKTLQLSESVRTGSELADLMPNVSTGFYDHGSHTVCIDIEKVGRIARGPRSPYGL